MKKFLLFIAFLSVLSINAQEYEHLIYAIADAGDPKGFSKLDLEDVSNYEVMFPQSGMGTEWRSSTWADGQWLAIKYYGDIYNVNLETGEPTQIISVNHGSNAIMGLTYDPTSKNLYANDVENLYTFDLETGEKTLIGAMGAPFGFGGMFGLSCDHLGNLYGLNTLDNNLYQINPETGEANIIGPLGLSAEYFICLAYDQDAKVMYASGLGADSVEAYGIYKVNLETGALTLHQEYTDPLAYRANSIAIPYSPVGVAEHSSTSLNVYPNPTKGFLNIESENEIESFELYDLNGKMVKLYSSLSGHKIFINIEPLAKGLYIGKIVSENSSQTVKITIE